jgi:site-specific recombinase XerD
LTGKGRKTRHIPLMDSTAALLAAYLAEHRLDKPGHDDHPAFFNQHGTKLSRGGIAWITRKYQAKRNDPPLTDADISPHALRHYVNGWVMWPVGVFPLAGLPGVPIPAT